MSWDNIESRWTWLHASAKQRWSRLTDGELIEIAGKRDKLAASIREAYGIRKDQVELQVMAFESFHADNEAAVLR